MAVARGSVTAATVSPQGATRPKPKPLPKLAPTSHTPHPALACPVAATGLTKPNRALL
jgi:hypothetical protein